MADNLRAIAARSAAQADDVFAKVGASATVSSHFLHCFAPGASNGPVDFDVLDADGALAATVDHFAAGDAAGSDPFRRQSLTATVGWAAFRALDGDPSPLEQELAAVAPRYAVIMYGTNDIGYANLDRYGENMIDIADLLIDAGVIPVFTTIMPRDDDPDADAEVPRYNAMVRAVAQARQVPLIDLERELRPLPDHGLGGDGIHPSVYRDGDGVTRPCVFTAEGRVAGYNLRNLFTLQTLDRARRVVDGGAAPDAAGASIAGAGTPADPVVASGLPFTDLRDTREATSRAIARYDGCSADQDESGAEHVYRLELDAPATVRVMVADRGDADIDVHILAGEVSGAACVARGHRAATADLDAGTYYVVADTFVAAGNDEKSGEYLLAIIEEP